MKRLVAAMVAAVVLLALFGPVRSQPPRETPASPPADATVEKAARDAIIGNAAAFDAAYNAHDPRAVADLFAENAEFLDEDGRVTGRDAIRAAFEEFFAEFPEAVLRTSVEEVRFPSAGLAIEEGNTFAAREPDGPEVERRYEVLHARRGDVWRIVSVREEPADAPLSPAEALQPLAWLVGDWIDESDESTVETSCRWSEDGNWLLQDYVIHLTGGPEMTGTQRIGWDASRGQIRSWSFDSEGGYIEAVWSFDGDGWTAQVGGVAADGAIGSGTRIVTPLGPDAYLLRSYHRVLDGEPLPDNEVTVVRRPPATEDAAADEAAPEAASPSN